MAKTYADGWNEAMALAREFWSTASFIPKYDGASRCRCAGCGNWTPHWHSERHDHSEDCSEVKRWKERREFLWEQLNLNMKETPNA